VVSLGIFSVVPSTEPCALRSTQSLKVSTRDFSWGKGGRCVWLTTYHTCSAETSRKLGTLIYPEPLGATRPVAGDLYFTYCSYRFVYLLKLSNLYFHLLKQPNNLRQSQAVTMSYCFKGSSINTKNVYKIFLIKIALENFIVSPCIFQFNNG